MSGLVGPTRSMQTSPPHKIPTGDPDRHVTVELSVLDRQGRVLDQRISTIGRWILWHPAIVERYDNPLLPLAGHECPYTYRMPQQEDHLIVKTRVQYHVLTDGQHEMVRTKDGLTGNDPYRFVISEREFPLSETLAGALHHEDSQQAALRLQSRGISCRLKAESRPCT
jgi:hypothetical protein